MRFGAHLPRNRLRRVHSKNVQTRSRRRKSCGSRHNAGTDSDPLRTAGENRRIATLVDIRIAGIAKGLEGQRRPPDIEALQFEDRLGLLVGREAIDRESKRLVSRLKSAGLRQTAVLEAVDMKAVRDRAMAGSW